MGNVNQHIQHIKKARFLEVFADTGNVRVACQDAGLDRSTVYAWRKEDPAFAEAWEHAARDAVDLLVHEAHRRAFSGVDEPVFYQGQEVSRVKKYSDTLLIFLLKGLDPQRFRDQGAQVTTVTGGVQIFLPEREIDVTGEKHGLNPPAQEPIEGEISSSE